MAKELWYLNESDDLIIVAEALVLTVHYYQKCRPYI